MATESMYQGVDNFWLPQKRPGTSHDSRSNVNLRLGGTELVLKQPILGIKNISSRDNGRRVM